MCTGEVGLMFCIFSGNNSIPLRWEMCSRKGGDNNNPSQSPKRTSLEDDLSLGELELFTRAGLGVCTSVFFQGLRIPTVE